jgi:hypothetical protein
LTLDGNFWVRTASNQSRKQLEQESSGWQDNFIKQGEYFRELLKAIIVNFELPLSESFPEHGDLNAAISVVKEKSADSKESREQEGTQANI